MYSSFKRQRNPSGSSSSSQERRAARRVRLLQEEEEEEELQQALDEDILRSINHNEAILKIYMTYLGDVNEAREHENLPPLLPFTRWSFNCEKLKEYIKFRAYFHAGHLEEPLRLATIVREMNFIIEMAKTEGEKIHLPQDDVLKLYHKMYCYSNLGFFVRKDKDQAIYGIPEVCTIIDSIKRELPYSGNINFEIQVISYFLLILFTGVRLTSLTLDTDNQTGPYLRWKHINIFRSGRDERGFKITVVISIPHLKGRGVYFTDAQRVFKRALVSEVSPDFNYDSEVDVVLYICALAFRRNIADYPSLDAWYYDTNEATLRFRDKVGNIPVFINSSIDEAQERNVPWKSGSAIPFVSNLIRSAGLNIYGSLNSFKRNFAYSINNQLSRTMATTLTGHTVNSTIIKKSFTRQFNPAFDSARLVQTRRVVGQQATTANFYFINDIKRYYLTENEIRTGIDGNEEIILLKQEKKDFIEAINKKSGLKSKRFWSDEDKRILNDINTRYNKRRRNIQTELIRVKFRALNAVIRLNLVNENCEMILNEDAINTIEKRPLRKQEAQDDDDDGMSKDKEEPNTSEEMDDGDDIEESQDDEDDAETDGDEEDENVTGDEEDQEFFFVMNEDEDEYEEEEFDIEEEISYEEDQAADIICNQGDQPADATVDLTDVTRDALDRRFVDIQNIIDIIPRPTTSQVCQWCIDQFKDSKDYYGVTKLATHLFHSQASSNSWPDNNDGVNGKHCNSEVWVRNRVTEARVSKRGIRCPIKRCKTFTWKVSELRLHLRKNHYNIHEPDLSPEESMEKVVQYFQDNFEYQLPEDEIERLITTRKNKIAIAKANRKASSNQNTRQKPVHPMFARVSFPTTTFTYAPSRSTYVKSN